MMHRCGGFARGGAGGVRLHGTSGTFDVGLWLTCSVPCGGTEVRVLLAVVGVREVVDVRRRRKTYAAAPVGLAVVAGARTVVA